MAACASSDINVTSGYEPAEESFSSVARTMSDGSVQIFGLDDPVETPRSLRDIYDDSPGGNTVFSAGRPSSSDPNVTVFSLAGDDRPSMPSGIMPPVRSTPGMPSPFASDGGMMPLMPGYDAPSENAIYFGHGSSSIERAGQNVIDRTAQSGQPVSVEGHASTRAETDDPVQSRIVNLKESMDRAYAVSGALIRKGVPADHIVTKAYGDTRPVLTQDGREDEAKSRRVELMTGYGGY